jgi:hypothetical protein
VIKRIILILTLPTFLASCSNSQTSKNTTQLTGDIGTDLKNLIPIGKHTADIMDGVRQSPRQATLTKKFQDGIKNNYEWFVDYMKTVPEGEPMPYHSKLGMTKEEYDELMGYINNIEIVSTGKENIEVEIKNDTIYFKSKGKLTDYNSLKIDLKDNTVLFGQYKMLFSDTSDITNDKNGLRSKWKGYTWKFEEPNDFNFDNLKDLSNLKMKQYKFTIGRLEKNGKSYISLKGREVEDGEKTVEFELPIIF